MKEVFFALKSAAISRQNHITLGTVCDFICDAPLKKTLEQKNLPLEQGINVLESITVVDMIKKEEPNAQVTQTGSDSSKILFEPKKKMNAAVFIKTVLVFLIMFFGGVISIIYFHADVEMSIVQSKIYEFITGIKQEIVPWVSIPYAFGLVFGFVFAMNIIKNKNSREPSMLEVEVNEYEKKVQTYLEEHGETINVIK